MMLREIMPIATLITPPMRLKNRGWLVRYRMTEILPLNQVTTGCVSGHCLSLGIICLYPIIWDEVPTMVEIAIFWFQIHITNGLNFMHRKWHTGNQYMVKSVTRIIQSLYYAPAGRCNNDSPPHTSWRTILRG